MNFVFAPPSPVGLHIQGVDDRFPVRRVYCVGRNYAAHAREMGFDPDREPPFFFCKPNDAASVVPVASDQVQDLPYPPMTSNYQFEVELVVAIGKAGRDIASADAQQHIFGYAVGLDMTRRDLQISMREQGRPWEVGKAFDHSAPIGPLRRGGDGRMPPDGAISLEVDGVLRQNSRLTHLIWSVSEVIANLSTLFALEPGDVIFTGTPEGVGAVVAGQTLRARIDGLEPLAVRIV